jgi:hypothetical protein
MNSPTILQDSTRDLAALAAQAALVEQFEEPWFNESPPSSRSSRPPPVVKMGEFLGDPEVDSWLR